MTRLAVRLLSYLGLGGKWNLQLMRLLLYAALLLPGFMQVRRKQQYYRSEAGRLVKL